MNEQMKSVIMGIIKEGRLKITVDHLKEDELDFFIGMIKGAFELKDENKKNSESEKPKIIAGTFK